MEFSGLNLTRQTFSLKSYGKSNMGDPNLLSFPLTGHLHKSESVKVPSWDFSSFSSHLFPINTIGMVHTPRFITSVVGGFVGSKSQRNDCKQELYPIGSLISATLGLKQEEMKGKSGNNSSQAANFVQTVFSSLIPQIPCASESGLLSFACQAAKEEPELSKSDLNPGSCIGAAIRLLSECSVESNDSDFIVFDEDLCELTDEDDAYEYDDSSDEDEDDEDDELAKEEEKIREAEEKWNSYYGDLPITNCEEPQRVVRFKAKPEVRVMHVWNYASRMARVSHWQTVRLDRDRFAERISRTEQILAPILTKSHRDNVWKTLNNDR